MVNYIKQLAEDLIQEKPRGNPRLIIQAVGRELDRLDPRDFLPAGQANLVRVKIAIEHLLASYPPSLDDAAFFVNARNLAKSAHQVLDSYGGEGGRAERRSFAFVADPRLRELVERDYRELDLILFPSGAWKSTVVMAGSILEAILCDHLTSNSSINARALAAPKAPRGKDIGRGEWRLHDLIEVAVELGQLPSARADAIDTILRDYRNFVHPMKEIRDAHPCTEAEALMAKGALDSVCNHLTPP